MPTIIPHIDIEHLPVQDDPRQWSPTRKNFVLLFIAIGSMAAGFTANIQTPAIADMEADLPATSSQISLTISLFVLVQGSVPLLWASLSEIKGRRTVYLISLAILVVGSIGVAMSQNVGTVIGLRIMQAAGSSAVMALGAGTLADVFDTHERGAKLGIYYGAPLVGSSLAPIFGGALTTAFNWRAAFWFLVALSGVILILFTIFFKDTFRRERSLTYQKALRHRLREQALKLAKHNHHHRSGTLPEHPIHDLEKQEVDVTAVKLSFRDISPISPIVQVLKRTNNLLVLVASGLLYGFAYCVTYTTSRTLGTFYHYDSLKIGLVLLSFGIGQMVGSYGGGRWSDHVLARKIARDGKASSEARLESVQYTMFILPAFVLGLAWVTEKRLHIAVLTVMLFFSGTFTVAVYSATLAYIVDANAGRSSVTVAMNSFFRGITAFVAVEISVPIQDSLGDGWMYTIFAGLLCVVALLLATVKRKGEHWRHIAEAREDKADFRESAMGTSALTTRAGTRVGSPEPEEDDKADP
ncbi:major facilitator superfamily domain-containing protein [Mycena floridula]|nr:major facilitator superfamily domain-containing protein [Mycena floridula]